MRQRLRHSPVQFLDENQAGCIHRGRCAWPPSVSTGLEKDTLHSPFISEARNFRESWPRKLLRHLTSRLGDMPTIRRKAFRQTGTPEVNANTCSGEQHGKTITSMVIANSMSRCLQCATQPLWHHSLRLSCQSRYLTAPSKQDAVNSREVRPVLPSLETRSRSPHARPS